ncbi:hypothetical protein A0H81_13007 [Grifola frondosa]|uniref:Cysteine-rich protein n=1 Tax=Grifola frondosa TaxID=5627 RepID=A0A1C7LWM8_GRIFR|nr:hypothetical protein A0H81_13007 [Grifola frondosa]
MKLLAITSVVLCALTSANAGLLAYGICQSGCNALAVACYAGAGFTFGTVTAGVGTPAAILACKRRARRMPCRVRCRHPCTHAVNVGLHRYRYPVQTLYFFLRT